MKQLFATRLTRQLSMRALCASMLLGCAVTERAEAQVQNVAIGTNTADNSALLHLESNAKGILVPVLTNTQMNAIATPPTSLFVYNITNTNFYYYNGTMWVPLVGSGWALTGDAGTSASTNFLGTIDAVDVVQKTNFTERMRVYSGGNVGLMNSSNVAEQIRFLEPSGSGVNYTAFRATAQSTDVRYILPLADGGTSAALITDGAGNLSWKFFATIGGGGSETLWGRGGGQRTLESYGQGNHAAGKYSMASGLNNDATGQYSMVFGNDNHGSGQEAVVNGGESNQSTGNHATIAGGVNNQATANHTHIGGGTNNSTSGYGGGVLNGDNNSVSGQASVIINGQNNTTSGTDNMIFGYGVTNGSTGHIIFKGPTTSETRLGIGTSGNPTEAGDIVGNVKFSTAIKPNNLNGTAGQYLKSNGAGVAPTWGTATFPSTNWRLLGSAATSPATNYIGTTDAQGFAIRTNNVERLRVLSSGEVSINSTSTTTGQLSSLLNTTTDESAAVYGSVAGASASQALGIWGRADNGSGGSTGAIGVLATGSGASSASAVNAALQISGGEFTTGRTTQNPSQGTVAEGATAGTSYTVQGPAGVIELSLGTDLLAVAPTFGLAQDLGTVTINNRYASANSIIIASVVSKLNGGGLPNPENAVYKVDIDSRTSGAFTLRIAMVPTTTDASSFQGSDYIRVGYVVVNPGR